MIIDINDKDFFYQDTARDIVDAILGFMNDGIKDFESYSFWNYNIPISDNEEVHTHFNWYFSVSRSEKLDFSDNKRYDILGSAGRDHFDEPSIDITVVLEKGQHQKKIEIEYAELFDVVAHELHHIAQNIDNNYFSYLAKEKGKLCYLLDPYEVEAFHIGIRAQANLSGKTFEEVANAYIQLTWPHCSKSDMLRIVKTWKDTTFPIFQQNLMAVQLNETIGNS